MLSQGFDLLLSMKIYNREVNKMFGKKFKHKTSCSNIMYHYLDNPMEEITKVKHDMESTH